MRFPTRSLCLLLAGLSLACSGLADPPMTQTRLEGLIDEASTDFEGEPGFVRFSYEGVPLACISDVANDRMRIVAPITTIQNLPAHQIAAMLAANYHSALDARYAVSEGIVYAAYLHPLGSLTEPELASALRQVATLAKTFGSSYSSGELIFGAPADRES